MKVDFSVKINSSFSNPVEIRETALAPCEVPADESGDTPDLLRSTPGLYPDPLMPVDEKIITVPEQWRTVWLTVRVAPDEEAGEKLYHAKRLPQ